MSAAAAAAAFAAAAVINVAAAAVFINLLSQPSCCSRTVSILLRAREAP